MEYHLSFTAQELQILDIALRKRPFEEVVELINKINKQLDQQKPKEE